MGSSWATLLAALPAATDFLTGIRQLKFFSLLLPIVSAHLFLYHNVSGIMVTSTSSGFESQFCRLFVVEPWSSYLTTLCSEFLPVNG